MRPPDTSSAGSIPSLETTNLAAISLRIRAEYRDMPGLSLTLPQAARLWHLEPGVCEYLLEGLVAQGVLRKARGGYLTARTGSHQ